MKDKEVLDDDFNINPQSPTIKYRRGLWPTFFISFFAYLVSWTVFGVFIIFGSKFFETAPYFQLDMGFKELKLSNISISLFLIGIICGTIMQIVARRNRLSDGLLFRIAFFISCFSFLVIPSIRLFTSEFFIWEFWIHFKRFYIEHISTFVGHFLGIMGISKCLDRKFGIGLVMLLGSLIVLGYSH